MTKRNTNPLFAAVQDELEQQNNNSDTVEKPEVKKEIKEKPVSRKRKKEEEKTAVPVTTIQVTKTTHLKLKLLASKSNKTFDEYLSNLCDNVIKRHPDKEKMLNYITLTSEIF